MKSVIVIGASGYGKVVADLIQKSNDRVVGFLDDQADLADTFIGYPLLGLVKDYSNYKDTAEFVIAIGNQGIREKIAARLWDVRWYTAIHPSAVRSDIQVRVGEGTVIMANAVINSACQIGRHCIINSGAVVEHDNQIADFVHVSVGAKLAGTVSVGKASWIGVGATVSNNLTICSNCIIGAGAVVVDDIKEAGTYVGVPAKKMEKTEMKKEINVRGGGKSPKERAVCAKFRVSVGGRAA